MKNHPASRRLSAGFTLAGALIVFASCSVDTSSLTFIPDEEFNNPSGGGTAGTNSSVGGDGSGVSGADTGGAAGAGAGEPCTVGQVECTDEGVLRECMDGDPPAYNQGEDCGAPGQCSVLRNMCLTCVPGAFRCTGLTLEQCDMMGDGFEQVMDCADEASCSASGQVGYCEVCAAGSSVCEGSIASLSGGDGPNPPLSTQVYECATTGAYNELAADCQGDQPICNTDDQSCGECAPGTYQCRGADLMFCEDEGYYNYTEFCDSPAECDADTGQCIEGTVECVFNQQVRCEDDQGFTALQTCNLQGDWQTQTYCSGPTTCVEEVYSPRCLSCDPTGDATCNGSYVQRCEYVPGGNDTMIWQNEVCLDCNPTGYCNTCYPGEWQCYPNADWYYVCDEMGTYGAQQNCPSGQMCYGPLHSCVTCIPNTARCDQNGILHVCNAEGTEETDVNCPALGMQCYPHLQQCLPAPPGQYFCDDNGDYNYVSINGNVSLYQSCGQGNCNSSYGCDESSAGGCTDGQLTCRGREARICEGGFFEDFETCSTAHVCQPELGCSVPIQVGAGYAHSCAILAAADSTEGIGYAVCWGANEHGQLGNGSEILSDVLGPRRVLLQFPEGGEPIGGIEIDKLAIPAFTRVCGGRDFSCAELQNPSAPGQDFVACWGSNEFGQIGMDNPEPGPFNAIQFPFFVNHGVEGTGEPEAAQLRNVTCGGQFACALDAAGHAYCWGRNNVGQLGADSTEEFISFATPVAGTHSFVEIAAGANHVCAVDDEGAVWCWGEGAGGELGTGEDTAAVPTQVAGTLEVSFAGDAFPITGRDFSAVLDADAENPWSWGANLFGQLADGTTMGRGEPDAMSGVTSANATALFASSLSQHFCLRGSDNQLSCAGANVFGQLGDGTTVDRTDSVLVWDGGDAATSLGGMREAVAVGGRHTCAINAANELFCWGANHRHQLGSNKTTPQTTPQKIF